MKVSALAGFQRAQPLWRYRLARRELSPVLISWLLEPDSLTLRGQQTFSEFVVQPVFQGLAGVKDDFCQRGVQQSVREVVLLADGQPFIFAHSVVFGKARGPLRRWFEGLGSRSLGSLLFRLPGFVRGKLRFARLDGRDALYHTASRQLSAVGLPVPTTLWARSCVHRFGQQNVRVTEVFVGLNLQN